MIEIWSMGDTLSQKPNVKAWAGVKPFYEVGSSYKVVFPLLGE